MATFIRAIHPIAQFLRWHEKDLLVLQPKFQRRPSWENAARSYLIDTVVRNLPMPKVYLRKTLHPKTKLTAYEVVDGQQRLRAILDFCSGDLVLSRSQNPELGDTTFSMLPDSVRRAFLDYEISTDVMENATDPEVWAMFERLNTYTLTLNRQEKLNAKFFGQFKQAAYRLAAQDSALEAWKALRVFTNRQIARMREVELTSDILVATVQGISDITDIAKAYAKYDREFPKRDQYSEQFRSNLTWLVDNLADAVRVTRFRQLTWFYSLAVASSDALFGLPQGLGPAQPRPSTTIRSRMSEVDNALRLPIPPPNLAELHGSLSRATSHVPQRRVRHRVFFAMLTSKDASWRELIAGKA